MIFDNSTVVTVERTKNAHTSPLEGGVEWIEFGRATGRRGLRRVWSRAKRAQRIGGPGTWAFLLRVTDDKGTSFSPLAVEAYLDNR